MKKKTTLKILQQAAELFPGGSNNGERLPEDWGQQIIVKKAKGVWLTDEDKNIFLDFYLSQGSQILGHADKEITALLRKQLKKGWLTSYCHKKEVELALLLLKYLPQAEQIRFFTGRQAAIQRAIALACLHTNREKVVVFDGCRHGFIASHQVNHLPLDDEGALENYFARHAEETALVILETLPTGSGLLPQRVEFLQKVQKLTLEAGAIFLLDESETAFRTRMGTLSAEWYLESDLWLLGGAITVGLPFCALAGKKELLAPLAKELPGDSDTEAGYLMGSLFVLTYLKRLQEEPIHQQLLENSSYLETQFAQYITPLFENQEMALSLQSFNGIFNLRFYQKKLETGQPRKLEEISTKHPQLYSHLQKQLLKRGVYLPPSPATPCYLSILHRTREIDFFIEALKISLKKTLLRNS